MNHSLSEDDVSKLDNFPVPRDRPRADCLRQIPIRGAWSTILINHRALPELLPSRPDQKKQTKKNNDL
jgi:hypothetical protein